MKELTALKNYAENKKHYV